MEISFTRIGLLMKKQFIENTKLYLFGTLSMMGIMSFAFFWRASFRSGFPLTDQVLFIGTGLISFGCLFSLTLFSRLDTAEGRTQVFMLPTTTTEKLICAVFYAAVIFPIVYLATVYPLLRLTNYIDNTYIGHFNEAYTFNLGDKQIALLSIFYVMQAMVLLCSVFFRQYKIVKSIALIFILFFGMLYIYPKIIYQFLPFSFHKEINLKTKIFENRELKSVKTTKSNMKATGRSTSPFQGVQYFYDQHYLTIEIPAHQKIWFYILLYLSVPFMWLITWFRLKESEVN